MTPAANIEPTRIKTRSIVLTGFMGSGKSTVGPLIARMLGWRFLDADEVIEREAGCTIAKIFAERGESAFREIEQQTIARLSAEAGLVLALGGGAIEREETRTLLLTTPGVQLVHLEVTLDITLKRCRGTEGTRPVLADRKNLEQRYQKRLPLYRLSHHSIAVDQIKPREVAQAVIQAVGLSGSY